jgi:hypothetical protein
MARFFHDAHPERGELSGASGVIFPEGGGIQGRGGAPPPPAVVMGALPGGDYEVLVQVRSFCFHHEKICFFVSFNFFSSRQGMGAFVYSEAEIRGMLSPPDGSQEGKLRVFR